MRDQVLEKVKTAVTLPNMNTPLCIYEFGGSRKSYVSLMLPV